MLDLVCVICAEIFGHSDDVHVTTCGHLFHMCCLDQWLKRSTTCPQCRNKCTNRNIFRVYFNFSNIDMTSSDVCSLRIQLDNSNLQLKMKDTEIKNLKENVDSLKSLQKKNKQTINGLEEKLHKNEFALRSYSEQVKLLKSDAKLIENLNKEVNKLKQQIESMENVSYILTGSLADAEKLLKHETDPKKLAILVTILKRELRQCENKKIDMRNILKTAQSDLRKECEKNKCKEDRISELESENYGLSEKIKVLETARVAIETNENCTLLKTTNCECSATTLPPREFSSNLSPSIMDSVRKIEESDSPYMNIKSSSIGLAPLLKLHPNFNNTAKPATSKFSTLKIKSNGNNGKGSLRKTNSDLFDKYSIFKKTRMDIPSASKPFYLENLPKSEAVMKFSGRKEKIDSFNDEHLEMQTPKKRKMLKSPIKRF